MPTPASQTPTSVGRPDPRLEAALGRAVLGPHSDEHEELRRVLNRPGVPWAGRRGPAWLAGMRDELRSCWDDGGQRCKRLMQYLVEVAPWLLTAELGPALLNLSRLPWHRSLMDWGFAALDPEDAAAGFRSLVAFLAWRWPLPEWAADLLVPSDPLTDLVPLGVALARGQSIRRLQGTETLPVPLSRRGCHLLVSGEFGETEFVHQLRAAQLTSLGGSPAFRASLRPVHRLGRVLDQWAERRLARVLEWMCRNEDALPEQSRAGCIAMLTWVGGYPFARRGPARVLADVRDWVEEPVQVSARLVPGQNADYRSSGLPEEAWPEVAPDGAIRMWTMQELRTRSRLYWEGVRMRHCVSVYHHEVNTGQASIWSLRLNGHRALTIEVSAHDRIVQVRGRANRMPHPHELAALRAWASRAGLEAAEA